MQNGKVNFVNKLGAPLDARGRLASGRKTPMGFPLTFLSPPRDGFAAPSPAWSFGTSAHPPPAHCLCYFPTHCHYYFSVDVVYI
jgi:hypothetical protein